MEIAGTSAVGMTEIDIVGTAETDIVGTVESGVKGMVETGATVGEAVVGIFVFAATPSSSKVSAIRGMDMLNKGRPQQKGDIDTYVQKRDNKKKKKKKKEKKGGREEET